MLDVEGIRLATVPERDRAFRIHVEEALAAIGDGPLDAEARRLIATTVRAAYPRAELIVTDRVVNTRRTDVTLHVYREGRGAAPHHDEPWWDDPSLPSLVIDATGMYVAANAAARDLVGMSIEDLIGSRIGRFTRHEPNPAPGLRAFDVLAGEGVLESTAVVVRPDGTETTIDYRVERCADGTYVMTMRPSP